MEFRPDQSMKERDRSLTSKVRRYFILAIVAWTALVAGLLAKDVVEIKRSIRDMEVRYAVSVSGPMERYFAVERKEIFFSTASFSLLWLVGMAGILFAAKRLETQAKEREEMERALHVSEKNYSAVFENSLTGIYILQEGKIKLANQVMAETHGYSNEELIGMDALELVHPEDRPLVKDLREKRLRGESVPSVYEIRTIRKEGKVIWVQRRNSLVSFNGKPAVLGNVLDVTPLKQAEEIMRRQTEELLRSNKELEAFATVASHDLQEPLRKIRNFGDLLERKFADNIGEEGADYLGRIRKAVSRMQALIDALLSYSRVTSRSLPFESISLKEIVHEVMSDLDVLIESKGASLHLEELPSIEADPVQMRQLFQNLISNSFKFASKNETPQVRIHSEMLGGSKSGFLSIFVEDNGIGFDEKFVEQIFYPFERLHSRAAYEGLGMGLAICRKIVERHGGVIEAKGLPGKGATFIITLPIRQKLDSFGRGNQ
jgi:two-component system sensor kinase FixL